MPRNVNFPIGHPHVNEVYTCHPHKRNFYIPLKNYSEELFLDRINEFSYLIQCLGATKLEIVSCKSSLSDQKVISKREMDANIDIKVNKAAVNYKGEKIENNSIDLELRIAKNQTYKPVKAPYIPTNLVWYHSDLNWQRLVDQRLNGSIMSHSELISSSQSENISSHELKQVDAELKLLFAKIGGSYSSDDEISISSTKKHEWLVKVDFEDVRNVSEVHESLITGQTIAINQTINPLITKYREDVLFMLEDDGIIDEVERKMLNRKIKKYGLTKEQAEQIEKGLMFNNNELKFIEEYMMLMAEGKIGEIEKRMLERYAKRYNINEERQKVLQQSLN